jgi:hypothetical protein
MIGGDWMSEPMSRNMILQVFFGLQKRMQMVCRSRGKFAKIQQIKGM